MKRTFLSLILLIGVQFSAQAFNQGGTLEVYVRNLRGDPISEANVYAMASGHIRGRVPRFKTDVNGVVLLKGLPAGDYEVHAYKESEGYADTFFAFFATSNKKAWQRVQVVPSKTTNVVLELGPKVAKLKLVVRNERGQTVGGSLLFSRLDNPALTLQMAITGDAIVLVPPVPFRFRFEAHGYQAWQSKILKPKPDETIELNIRLKSAK